MHDSCCVPLPFLKCGSFKKSSRAEDFKKLTVGEVVDGVIDGVEV